MHARSARGFTLIEAMMAVGIVGMLASVAIPAFNKLALRAKTTERAALMMRLRQGIQDYYVRNGTLYPASYGNTFSSGWNPSFPPTSAKRVMSTTSPEWNVFFSGAGSVFEEMEGSVYYSYKFDLVDPVDAPSRITILCAGDLDGDGNISYKRMIWEGTNGVFQLIDVYPAEGLEDDHGPQLTF